MKIIDGIEYIEYDKYKSERKSTIINIVFLILLAIAIILLFITITTVIKNKEMLMEQPIDYVMEKYDFTSCSCTNAEGQLFRSGFNLIEVIEVKEVIG